MKRPQFAKMRNAVRAFLARRKGWDTYMDVDGVVRATRAKRAGETMCMPIEHVQRVQSQRRGES